MVFKKVYALPILFGFWIPITVIITYTVSVVTNHVTPLLPYISDTGTWAPESCIFGIMLTIGAFLLLSIIYIRFRHVADVQQKNDFPIVLRKINKCSIIIGTISVCGCLVVANFQVSVIFTVHILGAVVCFGFGVIYQICQVIISFKVHPAIGSSKVNIFRIFVTGISSVTFLTSFSCAYLSNLSFKGADMTKWQKEDGGYDYHLASAIAEYILVIATVIHIVTFVQEFKSLEIHQPKIGTKVTGGHELNT